MMKKLIYLTALFFIVACASKKKPSLVPSTSTASKPTTLSQMVVTPEMTAATFSTSVKDFTFADYHKGKMLYESKCNGCHALIPPLSKTPALWEKMVPVMVGKYNLKNSDFLDESAVKYISGYLVTVTTK